MTRLSPKPITTPANIPADVVGFLSRRAARPERLAMFMPNGDLSNTFGIDDTAETLAPMLVEWGFVLDAAGLLRRA